MEQRFRPYDTVTDDEYDAIDQLYGFAAPEPTTQEVSHGFVPCDACGTSGMAPLKTVRSEPCRRYGMAKTRRGECDLHCQRCGGCGYLNVPTGPTQWEPCTEGKMIILSARWFAGVPMHQAGDARNGEGLRDYKRRVV